MMSARHSTAGSPFLKLCLSEWITHLVGTRGFNSLFSAALAEFELRLFSLQYLGKVNSVWNEPVLLAAQSEKSANGVCGWILFLVQATGAL